MRCHSRRNDELNAPYETTMHFSEDGFLLQQWSAMHKDWNDDQRLPWITWTGKNEAYYLLRNSQRVEESRLSMFYQKLHPALRHFLENHEVTETLTLLYSLKKQNDLSQYPIHLIQNNGTRAPLCFGFTFVYGGAIRTVDEMIHIVRKNNKTYLMDNEILTDLNKIKNAFPESDLSPYKSAIFDDFLFFYKENKMHLTRYELVVHWARSYKEKKHENPFDTLKKHRRTGCMSFLFIPKETASIKFFNKFLLGESNLENVNREINSYSSSISTKLSS